MKISKTMSFKLVLCVLFLGFSVSCSNDDSNKTTELAPVGVTDSPDSEDTVDNTDVIVVDVTDVTDAVDDVGVEENVSTTTNFSNVKAYVTKQTCSGKRVLDTWVEVDFSEANSRVSEEKIVGYAAPYCGTQRCSEMSLETHGARMGSIAYDRRKLDNLEFRLGDNQSFEARILPVVPKENEQGKVRDIAYIGGPVRVNLPGIGCDSGLGDIIECENNPCVNTPRSHLCTFDYKRCEVTRIDCAAGYLKPSDGAIHPLLLRLKNGGTFGGKTCVRPVTPIG